MSDGFVLGLGISPVIPVTAEDPGAAVDNLLLEDGFNLLLEDGSVLILE